MQLAIVRAEPRESGSADLGQRDPRALSFPWRTLVLPPSPHPFETLREPRGGRPGVEGGAGSGLETLLPLSPRVTVDEDSSRIVCKIAFWCGQPWAGCSPRSRRDHAGSSFLGGGGGGAELSLGVAWAHSGRPGRFWVDSIGLSEDSLYSP